MTLSGTESVLTAHPGLKIHWIWSEQGQDFYRHQSSFISESLREAEGELLFRTAEPNIPNPVESTDDFQNRIGKLDSKPTWNVSLLRGNRIDQVFPPALLSELPPLWKISRTDLIPESIRQNELTSPPPSDFRFVTYHETTALIETEASFQEAERTIRRRHSNLSTDASDPGYSGPLFTYKRGVDRFVETDFLELAGPINVGWDGEVTSSCTDLSNRFSKSGWEMDQESEARSPSDEAPPTRAESIDRYVLRQGNHEPMEHSDLLEPKTSLHKPQTSRRNRWWQLQVFEVSRHLDRNISVIGEARQEPPHLGHLRNELPVVEHPNYRFNRAKAETLRSWGDGCDSKVIHTGGDAHLTGHDGGLALIGSGR